MSERESRSIKKPIAVAVEGKDYVYTLLSQIDGPPEFNDVQLWDFCEGGQGFQQWLSSFQTLRNFDTIRSLGVIRDAEDSSIKTAGNLQRAFEVCGLKVPEKSKQLAEGNPHTAFLVIPDGDPIGCLEDAMIKAALSDIPMRCVNEFLACADNPKRNDNWRAKVRVHSLIAASVNPAATLGQSSQLSLWNFQHASLAVMVDFIRMLTTG